MPESKTATCGGDDVTRDKAEKEKIGDLVKEA